MNATLPIEFALEIPAAKKCQNCGSTYLVKSVQIVTKGGKKKRTVQKRLCANCRRKL